MEIKELEKQAALGRHLSILVTGKSGTGKRGLAHGLFGRAPTCPGDPGLPMCTLDINGMSVNLIPWTMPQGNHWAEIDKQLQTLDLVIHTVRMDDTRLRPEDIEILQRLSKRFGSRLWEKGMVVLTFANKVTFINNQHREERSKKKFKKRGDELKDRLCKVLLDEGIPESVVRNILFVPAGYHTELQLFADEETWPSVLLKCIIIRMKSPEARGALWKATKRHIQYDSGSIIECKN